MPSSLRSVANSTHSGRWSLMRGETWLLLRGEAGDAPQLGQAVGGDVGEQHRPVRPEEVRHQMVQRGGVAQHLLQRDHVEAADHLGDEGQRPQVALGAVGVLRPVGMEAAELLDVPGADDDVGIGAAWGQQRSAWTTCRRTESGRATDRRTVPPADAPSKGGILPAGSGEWTMSMKNTNALSGAYAAIA
ncbi:hypothetical protein [Luteimonas sp. A501]